MQNDLAGFLSNLIARTSGVRRLLILRGFHLLMSLFAAFIRMGPSTAAAKEVSRLRFELIDNRVFVPATVNGRGPFAFILDTGAPGWFMSQELARNLRIAPSSHKPISGAGEGSSAAEALRIDAIDIGGAHFENQQALATAFGPINQVIGFRAVDGIVGTPVFERFTVDLDFQTKTLSLVDARLSDSRDGAITVPFEFYQGIPCVDGRIAGIAGRFIIDLGDRSSLTLFGPFWRAHSLDKVFAPTITALTGYGIGGPIRALVARVSTVEFGAARANSVITRLSLQKSGAFADPAIAGSIGLGMLRRFHVTFDYARKRMLLVRGPDYANADRYDRAGMWIAPVPAGFQIYDVITGGPAAKSGLVGGDTIVAIDNGPASAWDIFKLRARLADPHARNSMSIVYRRAGGSNTATTLRLRNLL